jgi:predicted O-methyltransferase YrrM
MEWFKQFCGITMSSNYQTFDLLSRVLDPERQKVHAIIEIGTYTGSISIYLGLLGVKYGMSVITLDIQKQHTSDTEFILDKLGVEFLQMDVFEKRDQLFLYFDTPVFLLCDGGLKYEEFAMCVPKLKSGSIVAVHDYGTEFLDEHWEKFTDQIEPIMRDEWTKEDVRLAIFKIK